MSQLSIGDKKFWFKICKLISIKPGFRVKRLLLGLDKDITEESDSATMVVGTLLNKEQVK